MNKSSLGSKVSVQNYSLSVIFYKCVSESTFNIWKVVFVRAGLVSEQGRTFSQCQFCPGNGWGRSNETSFAHDSFGMEQIKMFAWHWQGLLFVLPGANFCKIDSWIPLLVLPGITCCLTIWNTAYIILIFHTVSCCRIKHNFTYLRYCILKYVLDANILYYLE